MKTVNKTTVIFDPNKPTHPFEQVYDFNLNLLEIDKPGHIHKLEGGEIEFLLNALREEVDELEECSVGAAAFPGHSRAHQVDALVDLIYFAIGGLARMGIPVEIAKLMFSTVHKANMQKQIGKKEGRSAHLDVKDASKPAEWQDPVDQLHTLIKAWNDLHGTCEDIEDGV